MILVLIFCSAFFAHRLLHKTHQDKASLSFSYTCLCPSCQLFHLQVSMHWGALDQTLLMTEPPLTVMEHIHWQVLHAMGWVVCSSRLRASSGIDAYACNKREYWSYVRNQPNPPCLVQVLHQCGLLLTSGSTFLYGLPVGNRLRVWMLTCDIWPVSNHD